MEVATVAVSLDEPCLAMAELNIQSPGSKGFHRYRCVYVVRADQMACFMEDLGAVDLWPEAGQFRIPGGVVDDATGRMQIVHTVGELYDIADYLRGGFCKPPELPRRDLWNEAYQQADEAQKLLKGQSSFGYGGQIQRSF